MVNILLWYNLKVLGRLRVKVRVEEIGEYAAGISFEYSVDVTGQDSVREIVPYPSLS